MMGGVGEEGDPVPDMPASFSRVGKEEMQRLQEVRAGRVGDGLLQACLSATHAPSQLSGSLGREN